MNSDRQTPLGIRILSPAVHPLAFSGRQILGARGVFIEQLKKVDDHNGHGRPWRKSWKEEKERDHQDLGARKGKEGVVTKDKVASN